MDQTNYNIFAFHLGNTIPNYIFIQNLKYGMRWILMPMLILARIGTHLSYFCSSSISKTAYMMKPFSSKVP
ncbi:hypothetical protein LguiA_024331 [Lonicera macranthoides]